MLRGSLSVFALLSVCAAFVLAADDQGKDKKCRSSNALAGISTAAVIATGPANVWPRRQV
jgi:hypothetical protein